LSAGGLQSSCLQFIGPSADAVLRTRLARRLVQPDAPSALREQVGPLLAANDERNLVAQIVLHNSPLLSHEVRARFRAAFATRNARALDELLGTQAPGVMPRPASNTGSIFSASSSGGMFASGQAMTEQQRALELAGQFWAKDFVASVGDDLAQMRDLGNERDLMLLACNLPQPLVRARLFEALNRQSSEGVAPFERARLTFDVIRDPGFLLLVKSMPREEPRPIRGQPSKEQLARQAWMVAGEKFVQSLHQRFSAACGRLLGPAPSGDDSPVRPFKDLPLSATYRLNWPADLQVLSEGTEAPSLSIYYFRAEGEQRAAKVIEHYKRQLKSPSVRGTASKGVWIDSLEKDSDRGVLRSVDVIISRAPGASPAAAVERLTVEVLWIEIPDPT
jgi:hypothetical protein